MPPLHSDLGLGVVRLFCFAFVDDDGNPGWGDDGDDAKECFVLKATGLDFGGPKKGILTRHSFRGRGWGLPGLRS